MADTYTTNLNLTKPGIGESEDTWGTKLNNNLDTVDGLFDAGPVLKIASGGTGATSAAQARVNLGLGSLATQTTVAESQITDSTILARIGSNETVTGNWTFSGTVTFNSTVSGLSISESSIVDGSILARVGSSETVTGAWTFTNAGTITRSGQGRYVYLNGSGNTGGAITLSTSAASGTPGNGDIWIQHAA